MDHQASQVTEVRTPKYRRIRDYLFSEIHSGRLSPGQSLPTEAKLAESLGISRNTIRQALGELEEQGMVERVQGRGTFVTTEQQRQSRQQLDCFALIAPQIREGFYPSLVAGLEQACAGIHHQMIVGNSGNDIGRQADLILQMIDQRVGGVALVPVGIAPTPQHHIRQLHEHHIPVVFCHRTVPGISAPCITWSSDEVGRLAGQALFDRGHRRVALLLGYKDEISDGYTRGLFEAFTQRGCALNSRWVRHYQYKLPGPEALDLVRANLRELLADPERPTAIFCGNQIDAEQIYMLGAAELGVRIPDDLSLIHFGGTWRNGPLAEHLACVAVDEREVGLLAGNLLAEMRGGKRSLDSDQRIVVPVSLLVGETIGQAK